MEGRPKAISDGSLRKEETKAGYTRQDTYCGRYVAGWMDGWMDGGLVGWRR